MTTPRRPQGVRVEHSDGSRTLCELAYVGQDASGMHVWSSATPIGAGDCVRVDLLPAQTTISFDRRI